MDDDGTDVVPREVGEIVHRDPQAMLGYLNDPAKTAETFRGGWLHSGDLGRWDADGYLYVVDRKKDMIKSGGENVSSREVEEVLYRHEAVAEVAVIGLPDPHWVEAVTAVVVARTGAVAEGDDLNLFCRAELAGYKRPRRFVFVEALPKNASGKVLKRELRAAAGRGCQHLTARRVIDENKDMTGKAHLVRHSARREGAPASDKRVSASGPGAVAVHAVRQSRSRRIKADTKKR